MITSQALRKFFGTPKGLLIIVLAILIAMAAPHEGLGLVAPSLLAAIIAGGVIDAPILRYRNGVWDFPDGAVLTGALVAMVLSPREPWYVTATTTAVAVLSKYVFRSRWANIFNPAALGLVATFYVFHTAQNWWGALPELPTAAIAVLFITGIFIADRVNKMPLVLVFLGVYYLLFTATTFVSEPLQVAEIFRAPDLHAVLFFAFFMLTDPPTVPSKYSHQVICAVIVAVVSWAVFEWIGAAYYLLAGMLVGNVWEAWRRWRKASPATA